MTKPQPPSDPPTGTAEAVEAAAARFLDELWAWNERRATTQLSEEEIRAEIAAAFTELQARRARRDAGHH